MRFYKMVRLLSLVKNPGMEPVGMILPLTDLLTHQSVIGGVSSVYIFERKKYN